MIINFTNFYNYGLMSKIKYLKPCGISLIFLFPALSIISNPVYLKDYTLESFKKLQEK